MGKVREGEKEPIQAVPSENLTIPEQIYVESRIAGMNKVASARAAGAVDNPNMAATRFEGREHVQRAMLKLRKAARRKAKMTRDDVLAGMQEAARTAATSTELLNAYREIGKFLGYYEERALQVKVEHSQKTAPKELTQDKLRELPLEELRRLETKLLSDEGAVDAEFEEVPDDDS